MALQNKNDINLEVITEFRKRHASITRLAVTMAVFIGIILMLSYSGVTSKFTIVMLLGLSFAYGVIVNVKKWRCPSCNGHLGKLYLGLKEPKYCPRCGIKLIEE